MPEIHMPKLSDTMTEGTLVAWKKKKGDKVSAGDVIAEIETDKATMEWESPEDGTLTEIYVEEGGKVEVGQRIAFIGEEGEAAPKEEKKAPEKKQKKEEPPEKEAKKTEEAKREQADTAATTGRRIANSTFRNAQRHCRASGAKQSAGSAFLSQHRYRCRPAYGSARGVKICRRRGGYIKDHGERFRFESSGNGSSESAKGKCFVR